MTQAEKEAILSLRQQQYSFSAIAETTGLPLGTIKSFLSRVSGKKETPDPAPRIPASQTCCRQCGAPLDQTGNGKTRSFCNDRCRSLYWNEHRDLSKRASAHMQSCEVCGRMFFTYHGRYCSRVCYGLARSQKAGVTRG